MVQRKARIAATAVAIARMSNAAKRLKPRLRVPVFAKSTTSDTNLGPSVQAIRILGGFPTLLRGGLATKPLGWLLFRLVLGLLDEIHSLALAEPEFLHVNA